VKRQRAILEEAILKPEMIGGERASERQGKRRKNGMIGEEEPMRAEEKSQWEWRKFSGSDEAGATSRGVAAWRRGVVIGRHFTLNFIQAFRHSGNLEISKEKIQMTIREIGHRMFPLGIFDV
jgi:hypothetical protein